MPFDHKDKVDSLDKVFVVRENKKQLMLQQVDKVRPLYPVPCTGCRWPWQHDEVDLLLNPKCIRLKKSIFDKFKQAKQSSNTSVQNQPLRKPSPKCCRKPMQTFRSRIPARCSDSPVRSWIGTAALRGRPCRPHGQTIVSTTFSPSQHCRLMSGRTAALPTLLTWRKLYYSCFKINSTRLTILWATSNRVTAKRGFSWRFEWYFRSQHFRRYPFRPKALTINHV